MTSLSDRAGFLIIANLVKYAVGFIMPMVLVRMLTQSDYGTYQQMILVSTAAMGIMTLGLPTSVYYFYHHVSRERLPALIMQTTLMLVLAGGIATSAMFFGAPAIADSINNPSMIGLLQLYAFSTVFMIASEHSIHMMIAQNRYVLAVTFEIGETFVRVLLLLAPLWFGFGFEGLVWGIVFYAFMRFAIRNGFLFLKSGVSFSGWSKQTFPLEQLGYSIPIALGSLTSLLGYTFNRGILAASFTPAHYAIYAVGALEIPLDVIFQASVSNVLRASLPPLVRDGNMTEVVRVIREAVRKLSIIVLPSFVFLSGHAYQFITLLFTPRYAESVDVFRIYLWLVPLHMFVLSPIPQIFGKTRTNLYIVISMTVFLLISGFTLLKTIGFYGPAIANVAAQYFGVIIYMIVVLRLTKTTLLKLLPIPHIGKVVAAALIALFMSKMVEKYIASGLLGLLLAGVIYSVVFLLIAALTGILTRPDRQLILRWIGKVLPSKLR